MENSSYLPLLPYFFLVGAVLFLIAGLRTGYILNRSRKRAKKKGIKGEERMQSFLDGHSLMMDRLDNIVTGDPQNVRYMAEIDHLVKGKYKILLIEGKSWNGEIRGGVDDEFWELKTQTGHIWKRRNPLWQADRQRRILRSIIGDEVPVDVMVVINGFNSFPDGIPDGVVDYYHRHEIEQVMENKDYSDIPDVQKIVDEAWETIVQDEYSEHAEERKKLYMEYVQSGLRKGKWACFVERWVPLWVRIVVTSLGFLLMCLLAIMCVVSS